MGYRTVFDVTHVGVQWVIPVLMFTFASLFALMGWGLRTSDDRAFVNKGLIFEIGGSTGIFAAVVAFCVNTGEYYVAKKALVTRQCSVTEGVVTEFVPMPDGGHSTESFRVNGVKFEYGSGWGSTVFNSEWNKGFIHDGVPARITYRGQNILKVEVR